MSVERRLRKTFLSVIAVSSLAASSAGCLDRPVAPATPKTTSRFLDKETQSAVDKIDLLFMIDNSISMADKQNVLAAAVPDLVGRLVDPICVDATGAPVRNAGAPIHSSGGCPQDALPEFKPVKDIHIGIVSSSLGGDGADSCSQAQGSMYNKTMEDMAHLITRGTTAQTYAGKGFLQWDPDQAKSPPGEKDPGTLADTFAELVTGTGQDGCGFEQSLEAVYRFLIDPDPYEKITIDANQLAVLEGTDQTVLQQRGDFLRPDSLVAIISISDENDCSVVAENGTQGWVNLQQSSGDDHFFLPRGTSACNQNPNDACCVNCVQSAPDGCMQPKDDPQCQPEAAPKKDADQAVNLRCFHEKQQFGIDFLYPVQRYMCAIRFDPASCAPDGRHVPYTTWEAKKVLDRNGNLVPNPLFMDLQGTNKADRDEGLVYWAMIVGVPWQDIARDPHDLTKGYMDSDEIAKNGRWDVILGDPAASPPVDPKDPLMIESIDPRAGVNPVTQEPLVPFAGPGWNPINGHEWNIVNRDDLQYACIFPFAGEPRDCAAPDVTSCDCKVGTSTSNPLCSPFPNQSPDPQKQNPQYGAKGYPGTRHLQVLKGLGPQGIPASICPSNLTDANADDYGYRPAIGAIIDRLKSQLKGHCLPRILTPCHDANDSCGAGVGEGQVPCAILEVTSPEDGTCNCDQPGHAKPPPEYITPEVLASRPDACVCEITQLSGDGLSACQNDTELPHDVDDGWCYVDPAQGAGSDALVASCLPSQQRIIRFANNSGQTPANGSVVFYTCQEGAFNPAAGNGGGSAPTPTTDAGVGD